MRHLDSSRESRRARRVALALFAATSSAAPVASAQDCTNLLALFQRGATDEQIAQGTGMNINDVHWCRREFSRPIEVGPAGVPPAGAAGPPPARAAGQPPMGAAGAPPGGRTIKRLP